MTLQDPCSDSSPSALKSDDVALALQLSHRFLREVMEGHYRERAMSMGHRSTWSKTRNVDIRALHGYLLPLKAVMQLRTFIEGDFPLLNGFYNIPCVLSPCFAGESDFFASLN